ncbi:H-NS histone family protein [Aquincola sp. MAHUQ-54]|uniref:H-NS histone family protein n=1 Tax=Aquincola agrisoli TaxID=3119538 RepID=A0AAW9QB72_9BURK
MSKTFVQLQKEIASLKVQAEAARKKEVAGVVSRIKRAIKAYGLVAADLGFVQGDVAQGRQPERRGGAVTKGAKVKYRDEAGHTWSGMGPKPGWLKAALADGRSLADFIA